MGVLKVWDETSQQYIPVRSSAGGGSGVVTRADPGAGEWGGSTSTSAYAFKGMTIDVVDDILCVGLVVPYRNPDAGTYKAMIVQGDTTITSIIAESAEFTPPDSDGNQVDNHLLLNDPGPIPDAASYVEAASTGLTDTYAVSNLPAAAAGDVLAVQATVTGAAPDVPLATKISVNTADSRDYSTMLNTPSSVIYETNPDTASPWTTAGVNNMTVGLKT